MVVIILAFNKYLLLALQRFGTPSPMFGVWIGCAYIMFLKLGNFVKAGTFGYDLWATGASHKSATTDSELFPMGC